MTQKLKTEARLGTNQAKIGEKGRKKESRVIQKQEGTYRMHHI